MQGGTQGEDELAWLSAVQCAIGNGGAMVSLDPVQGCLDHKKQRPPRTLP